VGADDAEIDDDEALDGLRAFRPVSWWEPD